MKTQILRLLKVIHVFFLMGGLLLWGCQSDDRHWPGPSAPGASWSLGNYWAVRGEESDMQIYTGPRAQDVFALNVPAPDSPAGQGYELVYHVLKAGDAESSVFLLDFEATDAATLCLGLEEGDVLQQADLYAADFTDQIPLLIDGPVRLFGFPWDWTGWTGPKPPQRVPPRSVEAIPLPLYASAAPQVTAMTKNPCEVIPTPTPSAGAGAAPLPFLDVVVTVAGGNGTSDIFEFYVQEPGGAKKGVMYDDGGLYFEDKTTGHADSVLVDQSWASGDDPFHMYVLPGEPIDGEYQAVVSNDWGEIEAACPADPLAATITVTTHTAQQAFTCNIVCDAGNPAAISATFPSGAITAIACP